MNNQDGVNFSKILHDFFNEYLVPKIKMNRLKL
jgi:hypothetical protein